AMLLAFFIFFFIDVISMFGPFSENTANATGILLGVIMSMIGIVKSFTDFLLNFGSQFSFLENWSAGALVFAAILVIALAILARKLGKTIKNARGLEHAFRRGAKVGADIAYVESQRKVAETFDQGGGI
ncbi:MAG: hypothetical protein ABIH92_00170, partial [Nanoarchaeota archaeon]